MRYTRMSRVILFLASCLLLSRSTEAGQLIPRMVGSNCESGAGPFFLKYGMSETKHVRIIAKIEDYVWSHWRSRRPGCVTWRVITAEGETVDISLFLEYDRNGSWSVRIERKMYEFAYGRPTSKFIKGMTQLAYTVQRIDEKQLIHNNAEVFPDSADVRPGNYAMLFRDKQGHNLYRLEPSNVFN